MGTIFILVAVIIVLLGMLLYHSYFKKHEQL